MKIWKFMPLLFTLLMGSCTVSWAQGRLTGDLQLNANFFIRDSIIGAANTPQYDRQKYGGESWLTLNYSNWGFDMGLRFDAFLNSNLVDPLDSYSAQGIGRWFVSKSVGKLDLTAGYIYDQIGSGLAFRSFEARLLAIDNALVGARLVYNFNDNWRLKTFTGRQKKVEKQESLADTYKPVIVGGSLEGLLNLSKEDAKTRIQVMPGIGVVNRTLDDESMSSIVSDISSYLPEDKFIPQYNTYVGTVFNTLNVGNFRIYTEAVFKTAEAINVLDPSGILRNKPGSVLYGTLDYSQKGFAASAQYKRTDHFVLRTSPLQTLTNGQIAYLPPMARQNTYRLPARYNAAPQEVGEEAVKLDFIIKPSKAWNIILNFSNIMRLPDANNGINSENNEDLLYREFFFEASYRKARKWKLMAGFQHQMYNQAVYEFKPGVPMLRAYTPFAEFSWRISRKKSIRFEAQYMHTEQDYGSWAYALIEYNIAPHWSFSISDMANVRSTKYDGIEHFYSALISYTQRANKFNLSYVRQVEGIVCTGGVCRYEPAFNGVRFNMTSRF